MNNAAQLRRHPETDASNDTGYATRPVVRERLKSKAMLRLVKEAAQLSQSTIDAPPQVKELPLPRGGAGRGSPMMIYLRDVRRHAVMSREEEHEIAMRYQATGDDKLADQLVNANLRLVMKIALEYRTARGQLTDLVQEGNCGLVHAVHKFDPRRGVKLGTYAAWWIRAYMLKFILSNARLVKVGTTRAQRRLFFGLRRTRARLEGANGGEVATSQLAASLSVSEHEVIEMEKRLSSSEASLDWPAHKDDDRLLAECVGTETLGPDVQSETFELRAVLKRELESFGETLQGRELVLFRERLFCEEGTTLAKIADQFGVSRERVRQIEEQLKERLRVYLRATLGDAVPAAA